MKKFTVATVLLLFTTSVFAWGDREQGILTGVAGLWIFQQLNKAGQPQGDRVIVQQVPQPPTQLPPPVGAVQQQQFCETKPVQDQFGTWRYVSFCYIR